MSGSHLCIPRNETVLPSSIQNRIIISCLPIPTFIYSQDRCAYFAAAKCVDRSWEYINGSHTHECRNWDWGREIPFLGIHKWNFRCSFSETYLKKISEQSYFLLMFDETTKIINLRGYWIKNIIFEPGTAVPLLRWNEKRIIWSV
jgi:hypothetical protein